MVWYNDTLIKTSLRKHMLRVDMRVYPGDMSKIVNPNDIQSTLKSLLTSAIIKGLDLVGLVTPTNSQAGWQATQIAKESNLDIFVVPGEDYVCSDKFKIIVYNVNESVPLNLTVDKAIEFAHKNHGWVMCYNVTKRQAQHLNKLKNSASAPDAIEIYNDISGGYTDVDVEYPRFVSSATSSPNELEVSKTHTLIHRRDMEAMGLLPEGQGSEYVPQYLLNDNQADPEALNNSLTEVNNGT